MRDARLILITSHSMEPIESVAIIKSPYIGVFCVGNVNCLRAS